mmetsp:Transcript_96788/g.172174  ORF Transcript_96788/g.172174 Transcript_96788/m.172174 type:complete len:815 (+) Transcript_96788:124-2568(+)
MPFKKHIRPGKVEASPDGDALIVHFTNEITHLDEDGMPGEVEKSPDKRELPMREAMRGLRPEDIPNLAAEVVEKCRYIPNGKTSQVEKALLKLYHMQTTASDMPFNSRLSGFAPGDSISASNRSSAQDSVMPAALEDLLPEASVSEIDEYVEELYEDHMEVKALGAQRLLRVCTEVKVLERVAEHSTLLGVLSRELRENAKRSYELAVAITGVFLCLARFSCFHASLARCQCGEVTMRVLEYESRRRTVLQKDLQLSQGQMVARGSQVSAEERQKLVLAEKRNQSLLYRQDHLLLVCIQVLRALSEDTSLEFRLVKSKICQLLIPLLARPNEELLLGVLSMVHKLSVFEQNKDVLVEHADVPVRLAELLAWPTMEVALLAMKVCVNLSFDERGRAALASQSGIVSRIILALDSPSSNLKKVAMKLLYHLSMDAESRSLITTKHPTVAALAFGLVARSKGGDEPEAVALLVNLASDEATACLLLAEDAFVVLMLRAVRTRDTGLLKVLRHVASHQASRPMLLDAMGQECGDDWLHELLQLAQKSATDRHDVLVEAVGVFAALECQSPEVPWPDLCDAGLLELLPRLLMVGFSEDDVVLEAVLVLGVLAVDPATIGLLAGSKVISMLSDLLAAKHGDGDLMVQLLFLLRCLLLSDITCDVVLKQTDAPARVLELLRPTMGPQIEEAARAVKAAADELLDLIIALESQEGAGGSWTQQIQEFRFKLHNDEWCQALTNGPLPEKRTQKARGKADSSSLGDTRAPSLEASHRRTVIGTMGWSPEASNSASEFEDLARETRAERSEKRERRKSRKRSSER